MSKLGKKKHIIIAEELLEKAGIPYTIPTAGHYRIDDLAEHIVWYPKSNKIELLNEDNKKVYEEFNTPQQAVKYIQCWLECMP